MAAQSTFRNMVLCLGLVCLVCAAILGYVYSITYEPIQAAADKALKASIGEVLPGGGQISDVRTCELGGQSYEYYVSEASGEAIAYAVKSTAIGFGGPLTIMVGVMPDGGIYNTSVLSHSETPGLGAKCSDPKEPFVAQWKGFEAGKKLLVTKDGGDVDAITASTITSRAYTLAVANAVEVVRSLSGEAPAVEDAPAEVVSEDSVGVPVGLEVRHSSLFKGGNR